MFDEPCRLTFIFLNVLYPQYRLWITQAGCGQKTADLYGPILPTLPNQSLLTDYPGRHFKLCQTFFTVLILPRFMPQH